VVTPHKCAVSIQQLLQSHEYVLQVSKRLTKCSGWLVQAG